MNFKQLLKRVLPTWVVLGIQKRRYLKSHEKITRDSDPDFRGIEKIVSPGDTVIDIGANMGFYTIFLSRLVGGTGSVQTIEPIQKTYKLLQYIVTKLRLMNVRCMNIAVSDHVGKVRMEVPVNADGEEDFYLAKIVPDSGQTGDGQIITDVKTIDGIVEEGKLSVSFMKIDVEGHELACLRGAETVLRTQTPRILIEVWGNVDDETQPGWKTFSFLTERGYAPYLWKGDRFEPRRAGDVSVNYFFLTPQHLDR